jgi:DNA-binding HxlR family transcriptional regulator
VIDSDEDELIRLAFDLRQVARGDWLIPMMVLLRRGPMQSRDIRDEMANHKFEDDWIAKKRSLSPSDASRLLTRMTDDGWLTRTETPGQWHPTVSYELSPAGHDFAETVAIPALLWLRKHPEISARGLRRRGRRRAADQREALIDRAAGTDQPALCCHGDAGRR